LRAADATERPQRREQLNGFENVGLSLRVAAKEHVKAGREIRVEPRVIAEITKAQVGQMHTPSL